MTQPPFHHVGVMVDDMDEGIRWFEDVLGVSFQPAQRMNTHNRIDPGEFGDDEPHEGVSHLAWSKVGPPYYELIEAKAGPDGMHSRTKQGLGLHHVGLFVPDVDAEIVRLEALGIGLQGRVTDENGRTVACWTERSPVTGLAFECIEESLIPAVQGWIERGERPQVAGAIR
jgi:catechol 2,3-dioxygenase-like lactoylglutathione lyase family enzyme